MGRAPAVELAGYLSSAVGVGEAARRYVQALRSAGVGVLERDVPLEGRDAARAQAPYGPEPSSEAIAFNLLCLNPEQMLPYLDGPEAPPQESRTNIGIWSWEVDVLPPGWRQAASGLAEVWTYSRFAAERIAAGVDVPVLSFPPPVAVVVGDGAPPGAVAGRGTLPLAVSELPAGFRVLVMFDYLSTLERKNPLGAIEAYRRAFGPDDGAVLVVKSVNGHHRPERRAEVAAAVAGRPDVVEIDETLSGDERDALIAACDCCLSLHRSEGHGLPLAEAMALGKAVVATAYGGNMEFMNEANSYPVVWRPAGVGDGVEHYPTGASWSEPDVEDAVRALRDVRGGTQAVARRVERARADVEALLAPAVVGPQMRARLEQLAQRSRPIWRNARNMRRRLGRRVGLR